MLDLRLLVAGSGSREGAGGYQQRVYYFLRHKIYKNSVSSVEAGVGMEGQVMCIEQCTF